MTTAKARTHTCPGRCGRQVGDRLFACAGCWRRLPRDLQSPITLSRRGSDAHWAGMAEAIEWYRR